MLLFLGESHKDDSFMDQMYKPIISHSVIISIFHYDFFLLT